jgi:hypothetical protein
MFFVIAIFAREAGPSPCRLPKQVDRSSGRSHPVERFLQFAEDRKRHRAEGRKKLSERAAAHGCPN